MIEKFEIIGQNYPIENKNNNNKKTLFSRIVILLKWFILTVNNMLEESFKMSWFSNMMDFRALVLHIGNSLAKKKKQFILNTRFSSHEEKKPIPLFKPLMTILTPLLNYL